MPLTRAQLDARIDTNNYPVESDGTAAEATRIRDYIWDIYTTPPNGTGAKMIDDWLTANPGKNIEFNFLNDGARAELGTGKVFYDEDFDTAHGNFVYLDENGVAVDEKDVGTIAHELTHALKGINDDPSWRGQNDYSGDNVTEAKY